MGRDRAAYMRDYRLRKRLREAVPKGEMCMNDSILESRIGELEAEVARLQRQLAARPVAGPTFNSRPFRPVPK